MRCPRCGKELPGEFPFCPFCGAAVATAAGAPGREERKVVTVVFADLAGFTARAETLDPEDVRAFLTPYHARLRSELERFGGTVEKFIGDAAMALFGAPVAHEDDAERAVRAVLAIRDWAAEQGDGLQVRIGVNTGEALVSLDAQPHAGEAMAAGDVVNTAARLESAAPLNGVLVGETTYRATKDAVEYRPAAPVVAKGKSEPVPAWEAVRARSRLGVDVSRTATTPLVGRGRELELLVSTLARVREERSPQLVTLVGVPGIGKSRLVHELLGAADRDAELVSWRQGRSLPYGEGVTFWALAEIVKAQAGILESDTAERVEDKLARTVATLAADSSEARWLERHLRPLVRAADDAVAASRDEAFAAWRRFFEALAHERPLVLVLEDLHWADDALLDFVDGLVDRVRGVPLLVLGTARPELLERRGGWGGGKSNALTISLSPLSEPDAARLVAELLVRPDAGDAMQAELLARAGGNPLYAEQYARALNERGALDAIPDTVQGIIAARLDALSEPEKLLLQDAAVVGKVFWLGAVEALDGVARWQAEELLYALERKEFVQRSRASSVASEGEYAFRHALIRDVAYGQVPRATRARKHRRAADWIESLGRPEDQAELLAHHYLQALELAGTTEVEAEGVSGSARRALRDAGDRAAALHAVAAAERFYDAALRLSAPDDAEGRADLLFRRAVAAGRNVAGGDPARLEEARAALMATGDHARAAEAQMLLSQSFWMAGRPHEADAHAERALALVDAAPPTRSAGWVLAQCSVRASLRGEHERAIELASKARAISEELDSDEALSESLNTLGIERVYIGDEAGLDELRASVELAEGAGAVGALTRAHNSLAVAHQVLGDLDAAYAARRESQRAFGRIASESLRRWYVAAFADHHYRRGEWDEALRLADDFVAEMERGSSNVIAWQALAVRALIRTARDDAPGALADADDALRAARDVGEVQAVSFTLAAAAHVFAVAGESERALPLARELLENLERGTSMQFAIVNLPLFAATAARLGLSGELATALDARRPTRWIDAALAYLRDDFVVAADALRAIGAKPDEAEARRRAAEQRAAAGLAAEADSQLREALAFYRAVGASRDVRECEAAVNASA